MTPNRRRLTGAGALAALIGLTGAGCIPDPPPPPHESGTIAFVVGGRSNMPKPRLVGDAEQWLRDAVLSKDRIVVVGVSGKPEILLQDRADHDCDSDKACESVVEDYQKGVADIFDQARATTPEADTLGAIQLAAKNMEGSGPHRIVVVDNGLQTTGELPLNGDGALAADPELVAQALSTGDRLAYLDDTEVLFTGLGAARTPQEPLPPADTAKLERLWKAVLTAGGATVKIENASIPDDQPVAAGMPEVGVVKPDSEDVKPVKPHCYKIRGDKVGFVGDQATFKDPQKAIKVLTPIAADLKENNAAATVVGTTAYRERDKSNPLSRARAKAVTDVLTDLGVDKRLLVVGGVGTNFPGHPNPNGEVGSMPETVAQRYRLVIISPVGEPC
ncbi:hypothetical protein AB0C07_26245 [Actinoplanes missouriensis]|uniref:hypothetical protein n=1 Tax=Actinoplanes missouriensis TaxID=1866 RepID=UPI0033DF3BF9